MSIILDHKLKTCKIGITIPISSVIKGRGVTARKMKATAQWSSSVLNPKRVGMKLVIYKLLLNI